MLCERCSRVFRPAYTTGGTENSLEAIVTLDLKFEDVISEANKGCYVCFNIWRRSGAHLEPAKIRYELNCGEKGKRHEGYLMVDCKTSEGQIYDRTFYRFLDGRIQTAMTSTSTGSRSAISFLRQKLSACTSSHARCAQRQGATPWYPTRLIDLMPTQKDDDHSSSPLLNRQCSSSTQPRLVVTKKDQPQTAYASLSHCWGGAEIFKLTVNTMSRMSAGIDPQHLPKTFTDAFEVARALDIRYIWIDSLCIIQDSAEDWHREAKQMHLIYRHAILNIAATCATNSNHGLFSTRHPMWCFGELAVDQEWLPLSTRIVAQDEYNSQVERTVLNHRGWVLQERLSSPRIAHFAWQQVFWDCLEEVSGEANIDGSGWNEGTNIEVFITGPEISTPSRFGGCVKDTFLIAWGRLIEIYSRSQLSFPEKDKLVAFSGIVEHFKDVSKDECLAGIWRQNFESQLLWKCVKPSQERRPLGAIAPSWSWLSQSGMIRRAHFKKGLTSVRNFRTENLLAHVQNVHVHESMLPVESPYLKGYVDIECYATPIQKDPETNKLMIKVNANPTNQDFHSTFFDYVEDAQRETFFLPILENQLWDEHRAELKTWFIRGLLVHPIDKSRNIYRRSGIASINRSAYYGQATPTSYEVLTGPLEQGPETLSESTSSTIRRCIRII